MLGRYLQKSKKQAKNVTKKEKEEAIIRAYYQARKELCEKRSSNKLRKKDLIFSTNDYWNEDPKRITCRPSKET